MTHGAPFITRDNYRTFDKMFVVDGQLLWFRILRRQHRYVKYGFSRSHPRRETSGAMQLIPQCGSGPQTHKHTYYFNYTHCDCPCHWDET